METLHRAGVKPPWVDRAGKIKAMHATLRRRALGARVGVWCGVVCVCVCVRAWGFGGVCAYSCLLTRPYYNPKPYGNNTPAEWARLLLLLDAGDAAAGAAIPRGALPGLRERWRGRLEGLRSMEGDLAFVNAEIDVYNLQVGRA